MNEAATATLNFIEETATAADAPAAPVTARFVARKPDLKLFMRQPARTVEHGVVIFRPGHSIQFVNHEFITDDPEEQAFLRKHRLFGIEFAEILPGDLGEAPRSTAAMMRGAVTTKKAQQPADTARIECGFVDPKTGERCSFVAEGETPEKARKMLTGHRTAKGHRLK